MYVIVYITVNNIFMAFLSKIKTLKVLQIIILVCVLSLSLVYFARHREDAFMIWAFTVGNVLLVSAGVYIIVCIKKIKQLSLMDWLFFVVFGGVFLYYIVKIVYGLLSFSSVFHA